MSVLIAAIVVLGCSGIIAQLLLLRELLVTFSSNELYLGVILANWLLLESAGSLVAGRFIDRARARIGIFTGLTLTFSAAFPAAVYLARTCGELLGALPGEGFGLHQVFLASFLILLPVSVAHGALFAVACSILPPGDGRGASGIGRAYLYEMGGTIIGGLAFTYLLVTLLDPFQIALGVSLLNTVVCVLLPLGMRPGSVVAGRRPGAAPWVSLVAPGLSMAMAAILAWILFGPRLEEMRRLSLSRQWRSQEVVGYRNSVYGNVAVVRRAEQYTFFANGLPAITVPTPDVASMEEFAHLPLLFHPDPKYVLVLSGGAGGLLHEILRYPVTSVDYAELDPLILEEVRKFPTPLTLAELADPRVSVHQVDGRLWAKNTRAKYDLILIGLSEPEDLQTNRYFTREFFSLAGQRLKEGGLLALRLPGSLTYLGDELRDLNACVINTLRDVFPSVRLIPGDGLNLLLASASPGALADEPSLLARRLEERRLRLRFITPAYLDYRLNRQWSDWFRESLQGGSTAVNRDFKPIGVYYSLSYRNALFSPRLQKLFSLLGRANAGWVSLVFLLAAAALFALTARRGASLRASLLAALASTGLAGMIFDLVLIFAFQALYGHVFLWVGVLVTAFMAGTAAGGLAMNALMGRLEDDAAAFLKIEGGMFVFSLLLPLVFTALRPYLDRPVLLVFAEALFLLLAVMAGALVGLEFPLASRLFQKDAPRPGHAAGALYGADLLGGWIGGIVGGVMLLPVLGLTATCLVVAAAKMLSLFFLRFSWRRSGPRG